MPAADHLHRLDVMSGPAERRWCTERPFLAATVEKVDVQRIARNFSENVVRQHVEFVGAKNLRLSNF
jgi:hypothetical protein